MIRVLLPPDLRQLAHVDDEVTIALEAPATVPDVLDEIEARFPVLKGTIRNHVTQERRPLLRFYACRRDLSHDPPDRPLPEPVTSGREPLFIIGAIAGG